MTSVLYKPISVSAKALSSLSPPAAYRDSDTGLNQALGVAKGEILAASVGMVNEGRSSRGSALGECLV